VEEENKLVEENQAIEKEIAEEEKKNQGTDSKIRKLEAKVGEAKRQGEKRVEEKEGIDKKIAKLEETSGLKQAKLRTLGKDESNILIEKSKHEVRKADLRDESKDFEEIERISEFDAATLAERQKEIEKRVKELGAINMKALASFNQLEAEVQDVRKKVEKLDEERLAVVDMIEKIDVKRTNVFMECFDELNKNFSKMFTTLFGGEGMLELSNREAPLESGLLIQAKHKGDSIRNIDSMSGGEKTMTALAFLFAIQIYEPAPFYVFDEADAALDKENSIKMAKIIKDISMQSQFIAMRCHMIKINISFGFNYFCKSFNAIEYLDINIIGHVHDEIIALVPEDSPLGLDDLNECMLTREPWMTDLPLGADGFESIIYKKD